MYLHKLTDLWESMSDMQKITLQAGIFLFFICLVIVLIDTIRKMIVRNRIKQLRKRKTVTSSNHKSKRRK